jgi:hypothetical protein
MTHGGLREHYQCVARSVTLVTICVLVLMALLVVVHPDTREEIDTGTGSVRQRSVAVTLAALVLFIFTTTASTVAMWVGQAVMRGCCGLADGDAGRAAVLAEEPLFMSHNLQPHEQHPLRST